MEITLPADALVVLVGAAGCGKSTFAARHFRPTQVVSSDECRALVSDDEANAAASRDAFTLMHLIVDMRLKRGRLTVADATNVHAAKRAELLGIAAERRRPAIALVFDVSVETCLERNAGRERVIPPSAVYAQLKALRESLPLLVAEGFATVHVLSSAEEMDTIRLHIEGAVSNRGV
jgi:predicted kinase